MPQEKADDKEAREQEGDPETEVESTPYSWEWQEAPTVDEVTTKLKELPLVHGIDQSEFVDYVVPLSQNKKIGDNDRGRAEYKKVWHLYFTVAGRQAMLNQAAIQNGWQVDFTPEPMVPEGNPAGYVVLNDERIVYREYVEITQLSGHKVGFMQEGDREAVIAPGEMVALGRRPGTASVPATGGAGAVSTNRWEKLETSARGRALAAWGFGVLPGSGVASLEEMEAAAENRQSRQQGNGGRGRGRTPRDQKARPEIESDVRQQVAEMAQINNQTETQVEERVIQFVSKTFDKALGYREDGPLDFSQLKDGELFLLKGRLDQELEKLKAEAPL